MRAQKKEPHFVSKYEGRRNGGIPCFAEERSIERAQKVAFEKGTKKFTCSSLLLFIKRGGRGISFASSSCYLTKTNQSI